MATAQRTNLSIPGVNLKFLLPTIALFVAEAWFLATQTASIVVPLIWILPMNLLLLAYAFDESIALAEVAMILFFARIIYLPYMFLAQMSSVFLFYGLFMAPVDLFIVVDVLRKAIGR